MGLVLLHVSLHDIRALPPSYLEQFTLFLFYAYVAFLFEKSKAVYNKN